MLKQADAETSESVVTKSKWATGNIVRIELDADRHCYGQVAYEPLIVFFAGIHDGDLALDRIPMLPVAFKLWVMKYALTKSIWPVIGNRDVTTENATEPYFFKQDQFSGRLALHHSTFAATNYEKPATLSECRGLECAAVWDPEHVVDRLRDLADGRPNKWVDSLAIAPARVPS